MREFKGKTQRDCARIQVTSASQAHHDFLPVLDQQPARASSRVATSQDRRRGHAGFNDDADTDRFAGGRKQKGIIHYGVSANRQNPIAGSFHDAIFNTFRRTKGQVFYWVTPIVIAYYLLDWATERYVLAWSIKAGFHANTSTATISSILSRAVPSLLMRSKPPEPDAAIDKTVHHIIV